MKASVLSGLFVATAAFGSSSIYLWSQLQDERTRAEELTTKSAELNTRIAELEAARGQFEERRFVSANTFGSGPVMIGTGRPPPPVVSIKNETEGGAPEGARWTVHPQPPVQSAAMQRMMRAQIRANNRRLYADVGSELGLSKEQANKLIDLRTDQQIPTFASRPDIDPAEGHNSWEERQQKVQSDIADLIGPEKAAALREYEKTLPDRQELDMVARQLESYDAPLSDYQRKLMLTAIADERARVPAPEYSYGTDMDEFNKARVAYEDDLNQRVGAQARSILNSDQLNAYNEYQQAQKDMRAQAATMLPRGPRTMSRGGVARGITFSAASAGEYIQVDGVSVAVPSESDKK